MSLRSFVAECIPEVYRKLQLYSKQIPIFDIYGIEVDLARALGKRVDLPSGGYLIIEQTEALTACDINTGGFVGKTNARQTILQTNEEAIEKLVEQFRIRNIGGIIVIDFIDMEEEEDKNRIYQRF